MKKEFTRDYVTEMFRKYAAAGMPTYAQERERIYNAALAEHQYCGGDIAAKRAEAAVAQNTPYLSDIMAVELTFAALAENEKYNVIRAVEAVYCTSPSLPLCKGDITNRIRRFALACPADISTVFRWLKCARLLCASFRGLCVSRMVDLR